MISCSHWGLFDREPVFISHFFRPQQALASQNQQAVAAQKTGWQQLGIGLNQQNAAFYRRSNLGYLE